MRLGPLAALAALLAVCAPAFAAYDPAYEARNFDKGNERARVDYTPGFNALLAQRGLENEAAAASILATDGPDKQYGRDFVGQLCWQKMNGCAGDVRLYDWARNGYGHVLPVLFTQRNGSTLSGHVWWTERGPAKRPGVVITNGSVQAPEELYWFGAQTLAKAGYVVLTWEPQGQGYSDTYGDGADRNDGVPSQSGGPFYDGTEDALDFFFSSPARPYVPRPSCSTGTSHADKQAARVKDGRSSGFNPLHGLLDPSRVGIVGQSLGAGAVSFVGQRDPRVRTIVAWDNLRSSDSGGVPACAKAPETRKPVPPRVPALGLAGDYPLGGRPKTEEPPRTEKQAGYDALRKHGLDAGEIVIRGGGHFEYAYIPNPAFQATARGMDLVAWYTTAWMDRYVKGDASAGARLATDRWRDDVPERTIDPTDANLFSTYYDSPIVTGGFACADLRRCPGVAPDPLPRPYSFLADATAKDAPRPGEQGRGTLAPAGSTGAPPAAAGGAASNACRDTLAPRSRITSASRTSIGGTASDRGCRARRGRLVTVSVSVARLAGRRCRFLRADGTFGPARSCLRTAYLEVRGTTRWRIRLGRRLPRGAYKVWSRGVDTAGNVERKARTRNFRVLRVRR